VLFFLCVNLFFFAKALEEKRTVSYREPTPMRPSCCTVERTPNALLALAALLAALGCSRGPAPPPARPDVLLVTIDTLRADRVGCYGRRAALTPVLDGLAARGVRFEVAVAHAPLTAPSHASILTGLTPLGHGVRDNGAYVLPEGVRSVAEDFRQAGYRTAGFVSGFPLKRRFGFDRGFETYDDQLPRGKDARRTAYVERTADRTTDAALHWLETASAAGSPRKPFFLWVHYFDPHAPYEAPAEAMAGAASPYDGEVAFVDSQLGRLLRRVEEEAKGTPTLVLVTADHGESLGEHGEDTHGIFLYDSTLRVPFLLAGPGVPAGGAPRTVARGIDVAPTLLDYAGLPAKGMEGRSLRPAASGETLPDEPAYAESLHSQLQYGWAPLHAWRTAKHKLIEAPRPELYDLAADPAEARDLSARDTSRVEGMRRELQRAMAKDTPSAAQAVDPETAERLAALGYVGTGGSATAPPSGRDPKDGIGLVTRLGRNGMTVARTEPEKAIRELTALLAEDPGMLVVLRTRAVAYAAAGRPQDAIRDLRELEKRGALSAEDAVVLGDNLRLAGRVKDATLVLERTSRENPKFAQPLLSLAAVRVQEKDMDGAAAAYAKVLEVDPDNAEASRGLGDVALIRGDLAEAGKRYARVLELDGTDAPALSKLGVVRVRTGQAQEAIGLFRQAVESDPKNAEALLYLAGALASNGRPAEAVPYFERALAAGPRTTMALNGLGLTRMELGDRAGAATAFRESLRLDPQQPNVAETLRELGRP
jgi:arylsulfatase A-like enzyme/tetratricopeptide (TPR) repeat protein